jgi:hypothetical protein
MFDRIVLIVACSCPSASTCSLSMEIFEVAYAIMLLTISFRFHGITFLGGIVPEDQFWRLISK